MDSHRGTERKKLKGKSQKLKGKNQKAKGFKTEIKRQSLIFDF
jgi:hypothetical protein